MKRLLHILLCMSILFGAAAQAQPGSPTALFYLINGQKSINSFVAHADKIGILVPTWYGVNAKGLVQGAPDHYVLNVAKDKHVPVMPIISMSQGRDGFHALLGDKPAQQEMVASMMREAKLYGYTGYQFDFENIASTDRDAFTAFAQFTADGLHKAGLKLSIAVVPNGPGYFEGSTDFGKWMWQYWRGVYDLPKLAKFMDLICLMTYDQNTRWTTPGPVAGMPWVQRQLDYALKYVPREKLSLGIALYGYHWFTGNPVDADGKEHTNIMGDYIDFDESAPLARQQGADVQWDATEHESWYFFYRDDMREYVWMPDAHAFRDRYELVKQQHLAGFCSWVLGAEDPAVWDVLPVIQR